MVIESDRDVLRLYSSTCTVVVRTTMGADGARRTALPLPRGASHRFLQATDNYSASSLLASVPLTRRTRMRV